MRGSSPTRVAAAFAAAALLAGCGSADDLKSRWLVLPQPPETITRFGPGTAEIADLRLADEQFSVQLLDAFDEGAFPEGDGGFPLAFDDGRATVELTEGEVPVTVRLSFAEDDVYYSDANGDSFQDALIVLDQIVLYDSADGADREATDERRSTGILALTFSEGSIGDAYYLNVGPVDAVSAIEGGFTMTTGRVDGLRDTIEIGWPEGVPVRIDDHGGAIQCSRSIAEIEKAFEERPTELDMLTAAPGRSEITGYDEQAAFPLPADPDMTRAKGFDRMVFLLDGGDVTRWTDYRCGWTASSDL